MKTIQTNITPSILLEVADKQNKSYYSVYMNVSEKEAISLYKMLKETRSDEWIKSSECQDILQFLANAHDVDITSNLVIEILFQDNFIAKMEGKDYEE